MTIILNSCAERIVGDSRPENVILLEIEPEKQKTRVDFACTETLLGIRPVCADRNYRNADGNCFIERDGTRSADRTHL